MDAYRENALIRRCAICTAAAVGSCARCNRPLCSEHIHDERGRCEPCELDYHERAFEDARLVRWVDASRWPLVIFATVWIALAAFGVRGTTFWVVSALLTASLLAMPLTAAVGTVVDGRLQKSDRDAFLRERLLLGSGDDDDASGA